MGPTWVEVQPPRSCAPDQWSNAIHLDSWLHVSPSGRIFPCFSPRAQSFSFRFMNICNIFWHVYLNLCYNLIAIIAMSIVVLYLPLCDCELLLYWFEFYPTVQLFLLLLFYGCFLVTLTPLPAMLRITIANCALISVVLAKTLIFRLLIGWPQLFIVFGQNSDLSQFSVNFYSCTFKNFLFIFPHRCCSSSSFLQYSFQ